MRITDVFLAILTEQGGAAGDVVREMNEQLDLRHAAAAMIHEPLPDVPLNTHTQRMVARAALMAQRMGHVYIGTEHLLWCCLSSNDKEIRSFLAQHNIDTEKLKEKLDVVMAGTTRFPDLAKLFALPEVKAGEKASTTQALDFFADELTDDETVHELDPVIGRDAEIDHLITILCRRKKNNPLLLGDPGVGKSALVEELAHRIVHGTVPQPLRGKRIFALDLGSLVSGSTFRGEFESRIKQLEDELREHPEIILFIDEIHLLMGAGNAVGGMDAANLLKPALARGDIRCIGATTLSEYRQSIEKDGALNRRFQPLEIREPNRADTIEILKGIAPSYSKHHNVRFSPQALEAAVDFSIRYFIDKQLPDKAIDLLDESAASVRAHRAVTAEEQEIEKLEQTLRETQAKKIEAAQHEKFDEAIALKHTEDTVASALEKAKKSTKKAAATTITPQHIAAAVSRKSGIPVDFVIGGNEQQFAELEQKLSAHIVGQTEALGAISNALRRAASGIGDPSKPVGSFIFLGPTGVGKTETVKALAKLIFHDEKSLIRFDMSEFGEPHSVAKLVGAPAGYIGHESGGQLVNAVRRRPYSVILFDEIEKAHRDVSTLLLQILDEGRLTDSHGKVADFRQSIIILTSNIGGEFFKHKKSIGFSTAASGEIDMKQASESVMQLLQKSFKPELLARLDHAIIFQPLTEKEGQMIARKILEELTARLSQKKVSLTFSDDVLTLAAKQMTATTGARGIAKFIRIQVEDPIAAILLEKPRTKSVSLAVDGQKIKVSAK